MTRHPRISHRRHGGPLSPRDERADHPLRTRYTGHEDNSIWPPFPSPRELAHTLARYWWETLRVAPWPLKALVGAQIVFVLAATTVLVAGIVLAFRSF